MLNMMWDFPLYVLGYNWLKVFYFTFCKINLLFPLFRAINRLFLAKYIARKMVLKTTIPGTTLAATMAPFPIKYKDK